MAKKDRSEAGQDSTDPSLEMPSLGSLFGRKKRAGKSEPVSEVEESAEDNATEDAEIADPEPEDADSDDQELKDDPVTGEVTDPDEVETILDESSSPIANDAQPGEAVLDSPVPEGAVPDGAVPDDAVPDEAVPDEAVPDEAVPEGPEPGETAERDTDPVVEPAEPEDEPIDEAGDAEPEVADLKDRAREDEGAELETAQLEDNPTEDNPTEDNLTVDSEPEDRAHDESAHEDGVHEDGAEDDGAQDDGELEETVVLAEIDVGDVGATDEDEHPDEHDDGAGRERRTFSLPALPSHLAATVTGVLVGLLTVGGTMLALGGCERLRGTSTCGGPGFFLIVAILLLLILAGSKLLQAWGIADPLATSILGVGLLAVICLLFLIDALMSPWMIVVIPLVAVGTFVLSTWVTETFTDAPVED